MYKVLFDITPTAARVRVTLRLATILHQRGCDVRYTNDSDSVFTEELLRQGIGLIFYPGDQLWYRPDLVLLDCTQKERMRRYQQQGIEPLLVEILRNEQEKTVCLQREYTLLRLPPARRWPTRRKTRRTDLAGPIEIMKEEEGCTAVIGVAVEADHNPARQERFYRCLKQCATENPDLRFVLLTDRWETKEMLFALPGNMTVYHPDNLPTVFPSCDLALVTDDWETQVECVFAHTPTLELASRSLPSLTPGRLEQRIKDALQHKRQLRERLVKQLRFYEEQNEKLEELADWLLIRMEQRNPHNPPPKKTGSYD